MTAAFTKIEGTTFYHVFDGRTRIMRVRVKDHDDGSLTVAKFAGKRNIKLSEAFLESDAANDFREASVQKKVKTLFKLVG